MGVDLVNCDPEIRAAFFEELVILLEQRKKQKDEERHQARLALIRGRRGR